MKKGTLAAGALAASTMGTIGTTTAQDDDNDNDEEGEVVLHVHDYNPGDSFTVVADLDSATASDFIDETYEDVFTDIDDWDVYLFNYEERGTAGKTGILLTEEVSLDVGDDGTFDESASFRDSELNLVETDITAEPVDDEVDDEDDEVDDEDDEVDDEDDEVDDEDDEVDDEDDEVDDEDDEVDDENDNDDNDDVF